MDRETARHEMLSTPTASLYHIRKKWESQHTLSIAEWDVLAQYVQIGAEEEAQEPPLLWPAIPSRESYLTLLDAFEAVYQNRKKSAWEHAGITSETSAATPRMFGSPMMTPSEAQAVLKQIAIRKELLKPSEKWQSPGTVGGCFLTAIRDEGVESTRLDQILPPIGRLSGALLPEAIGCGTTASRYDSQAPTRMGLAHELSCLICWSPMG